jgi:tripartite-type tricarboxylate transporter receptor subunit TctC
VKKLNTTLNKVIVAPDVVERFAQIGAEPIPGTPEKFATMVAKERMRWSILIKQAQITAE